MILVDLGNPFLQVCKPAMLWQVSFIQLPLQQEKSLIRPKGVVGVITKNACLGKLQMVIFGLVLMEITLPVLRSF